MADDVLRSAIEICALKMTNPLISLLRFICAIVVLLYHIHFPGFSYGFLAVDVFLVLSGFLVGGPALIAAQSGTFVLVSFIKKRISRITPTLLSGYLIAVLGGYVLLLPTEYVKLSKSIIMSISALSNYYFSFTAGYFDVEPRDQPLLHFWSLSLEIQFYIITGSIAFIIQKFKFIKVEWLLCTGLMLSIGYYFYYIYIGNINATHFHFESRVYQFICGSLLYIYLTRKEPKICIKLTYAFFVVAAIVISTLIDWQIIQNHLNLTTTFFTLILIYHIARQQTLAKYKTNEFMKFLGDISFQIYIFHYIVLSLLSQIIVSQFYINLFTVLLTLGLSSLQFIAEKRILLINLRTILVMTLLMSFVSLGIILGAGLPKRMTTKVDLSPNYGLSPNCDGSLAVDCIDGNFQATVLLGDSLAMSIAKPLSKSIGGIVQITKSDCTPFLSEKHSNCIWLEQTLSSQASVKRVVISSTFRKLRDPNSFKTFKKNIDDLTQRYESVIIVLPAPYFTSTSQCLKIHLMQGTNVGCNLLESNAANKDIRDLLNNMTEYENLKVWDLADVLCENGICHPVKGNVILLRDNLHFTNDSSQKTLTTYFASKMSNALEL